GGNTDRSAEEANRDARGRHGEGCAASDGRAASEVEGDERQAVQRGDSAGAAGWGTVEAVTRLAGSPRRPRRMLSSRPWSRAELLAYPLTAALIWLQSW